MAQRAGQKLALEVFVAGRNRLENDGATALSEVFEVCVCVCAGVDMIVDLCQFMTDIIL